MPTTSSRLYCHLIRPDVQVLDKCCLMPTLQKSQDRKEQPCFLRFLARPDRSGEGRIRRMRLFVPRLTQRSTLAPCLLARLDRDEPRKAEIKSGRACESVPYQKIPIGKTNFLQPMAQTRGQIRCTYADVWALRVPVQAFFRQI